MSKIVRTTEMKIFFLVLFALSVEEKWPSLSRRRSLLYIGLQSTQPKYQLNPEMYLYRERERERELNWRQEKGESIRGGGEVVQNRSLMLIRGEFPYLNPTSSPLPPVPSYYPERRNKSH